MYTYVYTWEHPVFISGLRGSVLPYTLHVYPHIHSILWIHTRMADPMCYGILSTAPRGRLHIRVCTYAYTCIYRRGPDFFFFLNCAQRSRRLETGRLFWKPNKCIYAYMHTRVHTCTYTRRLEGFFGGQIRVYVYMHMRVHTGRRRRRRRRRKVYSKLTQ